MTTNRCVWYPCNIFQLFQRKRIGEILNIKTVFKTKYVLGNFFFLINPNHDMLDHNTFIEFQVSVVREYIGVTSRP